MAVAAQRIAGFVEPVQGLRPPHRPDGRPVERGPSFATVQEMLALVEAGVDTYLESAQFTSYYVRPDVAYVPIHDGPPYQRRFVWLTAAETVRVLAFDRVAVNLAKARQTTG